MDSVQKYVDNAVPPEQREKYNQDLVDFVKHSPLLSSFLTTQFTFSSIPLGIFAIVAISTLLLSIGVALVFSAIVIVGAFLLVLPILLVTTTTATLVWATTISAYAIANWLYTKVYKDSSFELQVQHTRDQALRFKHEIDQYGAQEAEYYVNGAKKQASDVTNGVKQIADNGIDTMQHSYNQARDTAQNGYGQLKDSANKTADHVQRTANGAKDALMKDDGIVDGIKAKGNRLGNNVKESPLAYDANAALPADKQYKNY